MGLSTLAKQAGYGAAMAVLLGTLFWLSPTRTAVLGYGSLAEQVGKLPGLGSLTAVGRKVAAYEDELEELRAAGADADALRRAGEELAKVREYRSDRLATDETVTIRLYSRVDPHMIAARKSIGLKPGERL